MAPLHGGRNNENKSKLPSNLIICSSPKMNLNNRLGDSVDLKIETDEVKKNEKLIQGLQNDTKIDSMREKSDTNLSQGHMQHSSERKPESKDKASLSQSSM